MVDTMVDALTLQGVECHASDSSLLIRFHTPHPKLDLDQITQRSLQPQKGDNMYIEGSHILKTTHGNLP